MWIPQIRLYLIYSTQAFTKQYIFVPTGGHLVSSETSRQHWEMDIPTSCTLPGHQAGHPPWELEKERQLSQGIFKTFCFLLRVSFSNNFCQFSLLPWKTVMLCVWKVQPLWFKILADSQNNCLRRENKGRRNTHSSHNFLFNSFEVISFLAQRSSKKNSIFAAALTKCPHCASSHESKQFLVNYHKNRRLSFPHWPSCGRQNYEHKLWAGDFEKPLKSPRCLSLFLINHHKTVKNFIDLSPVLPSIIYHFWFDKDCKMATNHLPVC